MANVDLLFRDIESLADDTIVGSRKLDDFLKELVDISWENGLEPLHIDKLARLFTDHDMSSRTVNLILDCMVPQRRISDGSCNLVLLWVISRCTSAQEDCAQVLKWLKTMIRYRMVEADWIDSWYNIIMKYLAYPKLVVSICEILCLGVKPKFTTEINTRLLESYYRDNESPHIKRVLWEFAKHAPHLVSPDFHFSKPAVWEQSKLSSFEVVVKAMASKAGELDMDFESTNITHSLCSSLPKFTYSKPPQGADLQKISEVKSITDLGRAYKRIQLPLNELSMVQSEAGIMYIIVNGPSQNFLHSLAAALSKNPSDTLIESISGLQDLLSYGFPCVTGYLSDFICVWDGKHKEEYVYSLIPHLYFNSFKELRISILDPLFRVFATSLVETKINILESLLQLITNLMSVDAQRYKENTCQFIAPPQWLDDYGYTLTSIINYVNLMYFKALLLEGPDCTSLVLKSVLYYQKLNKLILSTNFPTFFVIHPSLSYPALTSKNYVVIDQLCHLILSYKRELIPVFEKQGLLGELEIEFEAVRALADSTFKYLWESVGGERPENFHVTQDEFTPEQSVGIHHLGLYPFLLALCNNLGQNLETLEKSNIMMLLETFMGGLSSFIKYEEEDQIH